MAYEVLARKWRPQQFADVVGQAHVTDTLNNAIASSRIAHAYLFVGPRGIGKTSIARIFAKALNCEKGPTATPCDECDVCREIMGGMSLDVMEIDGASNNGVEQVRELRETVKYAPNRGRYKIYIIDEVHMLSTAAFNALLKTLEEPPPYVKFIFATTEPDKVLATIISRCQRFDLRRIPTQMILERLQLIAKAEKVEADENALLAVARGAEGGLRDAESALDQLISFKGNRISEDDVLSVFGLVARSTLESLAEKVLRGDIRGIISLVVSLDEAGKDLKRLLQEMIEHFRNLLVCMHCGDATEGLDLTDSQVEVLRAQCALTDTERVLRIAGILGDADDRMRYALSKRTLLETGLVRCAQAATVASLEQILQKVNALLEGAPAGASPSPAPAAPSAVPSSQAPASGVRVVANAAARPAPKVVRETARRTLGDDLKLLKEKWDEVAERVGRMAVTTRGVLKDAEPVDVQELRVVVAFNPEFAGARDAVESGRARLALEKSISLVLGRDVTVEIRVGEGGAEPAGFAASADPTGEEDSREDAAGEEFGDVADSPPPAAEQKRGRAVQAWINEPAVRKTLDMFDGTILEVRE